MAVQNKIDKYVWYSLKMLQVILRINVLQIEERLKRILIHFFFFHIL